MSNTIYELSPQLQENINLARIGDPDLNERTRNDQALACIVANYIKVSYEVGLEYIVKATRSPDSRAQYELGKHAIDCFQIANERAARITGLQKPN